MKKTLSALLVLCVLAFAAIPVYAVTDQKTVEPLRYTCISNPQASYSEINSTCTCSGRVRISSGATTTMKVYLQISYDSGVTYMDYYLIDSKQFTGTGSYIATGSKQGLSSNYMYRAALYVSVYDANGRLIDHAEAYSS